METQDVPDSYTESTEYILRTRLLDAASGDSVWQMFSSTVDPGSLEKAAKDYARVVVRELNHAFNDAKR